MCQKDSHPAPDMLFLGSALTKRVRGVERSLSDRFAMSRRLGRGPEKGALESNRPPAMTGVGESDQRSRIRLVGGVEVDIGRGGHGGKWQ